jgi:three-Cys-motif partner protein
LQSAFSEPLPRAKRRICTYSCAIVSAMDPLPSLVDDGLATPIVGDWSEDKYQLAKCYASIFASSMKNKWDCLVYVDLYSGSGRARISDSFGKIVPATPLLVLDRPNPFTKYIFCELDPPKLDSLRRRVNAAHPAADVHFVEGDCNARVDEISTLIPSYSKNYRVLTFCFVDPYNLGSLSFATIERLSNSHRIDFLVLAASGMDANRNRELYLRTDNQAIARFVGTDEWRTAWPKSRMPFGDFVADQFGLAMRRLGYVYEGLSSLHWFVQRKRIWLYITSVFSVNIRWEQSSGRNVDSQPRHSARCLDSGEEGRNV